MNTSSFSYANSEPFFARVVSCPHWEDHHIERAKSANDFKLLGELVCEVAEKMPKPLFMVSGPMTTGGMGSYSKNILLFQHAIDEAIKAGVTVFNQTMLEEHLQRLVREWLTCNPESEYCNHVLTDVYEALLASGHIHGVYFMPDWHTSRGARWEREASERLNVAVHDYPSEWYEKATSRTKLFFNED